MTKNTRRRIDAGLQGKIALEDLIDCSTAPLDLQQIKNKKTDFFKAALEDAAR
jgi:hypothetical protein